MSPTTAIVVTISPPPPSPCSARNAISSVMFWLDAAERRADQEDHDRRLQHDLAAVEVAELAVERARDGRREQVGGHDPRQVLDPAEIADDRRQRGRDDRLVERREQQHQQQRRRRSAGRARAARPRAARRPVPRCRSCRLGDPLVCAGGRRCRNTQRHEDADRQRSGGHEERDGEPALGGQAGRGERRRRRSPPRPGSPIAPPIVRTIVFMPVATPVWSRRHRLDDQVRHRARRRARCRRRAGAIAT